MQHQQTELLNEAEAARLIGMSVAFLRTARCRGMLGRRTPAPAHLELGRAIRYDRRDLEAWLQARRVDPSRRHAADRASAT